MGLFDYQTVRGDTTEVLSSLAFASVGLALWHRPPPRLSRAALMRVAESELDVVLEVDRSEPAALSSALAAEQQLASDSATEALVQDVCGLALLFGTVSGRQRMQVRLQAVRSDACSRFHADACELRLLTTYVGAPTQVVPSHDSERAIDVQCAYEGPFVDVPEGTVSFLRGRRPGFGGIVHRSPPFIPGRSVARRVLCITSREP